MSRLAERTVPVSDEVSVAFALGADGSGDGYVIFTHAISPVAAMAADVPECVISVAAFG
ncbi:hypothetical protein LPH52_09670 [Xylella taiwanensis]|uniref:hypothetical protein n=1 Tax=Xylella taiwanensis TaxID=1444770 RepID=UPI00135F1B6E|nr:hypothetical protein [Xylella taiwanensis]MCD8457094.1 hypothetical protein [Xylella taiwanensis]UFS49885.1 hypothetical protein LPH54_01575 [Xylella taiwanensis]